MIEPHKHNKIDSPPVNFTDLDLPIPSSSTASTGLSAGVAYTINEQSIINNHETRIKEIVALLKSLGFIK